MFLFLRPLDLWSLAKQELGQLRTARPLVACKARTFFYLRPLDLCFVFYLRPLDLWSLARQELGQLRTTFSYAQVLPKGDCNKCCPSCPSCRQLPPPSSRQLTPSQVVVWVLESPLLLEGVGGGFTDSPPLCRRCCRCCRCWRSSEWHRSASARLPSSGSWR